MISFLKYPDVGLFLRSGHANYSMLYAETNEMFGVRHPHHVQMSFHNSLFRHGLLYKTRFRYTFSVYCLASSVHAQCRNRGQLTHTSGHS